MAKKYGITDWSRKVDKPRLSRRSKLRAATVSDRRTWPTVFRIKTLEGPTPERIEKIMAEGFKAKLPPMTREAKEAFREFLKTHSVKDWTRS